MEEMDKPHEMDSVLRKEGSLLNHGTTAEINATTLTLSSLGEYRPCVRATSRTIGISSLMVAGDNKIAISRAIAVLAFPCSDLEIN